MRIALSHVVLTAIAIAVAGSAARARVPPRSQTAAPDAPAAQALQQCAGLRPPSGPSASGPATLTATFHDSSRARPAPNPLAPPVPALPAHCEVVGSLDEREGAGGQHYAIRFRLRLPAEWNGRFFFEGGGGSNGVVGNAYGALQGQQPTVALALGYAVVSQDSGHDNMANNDPMRGGAQTFGFDPQARIDFGYRSYDLVARTAKTIIERYYGRAPQKSYFVGCSEGGREGMMAAERFPADFDGVLACSPGMHLPRAAVAEAWDSQAFAEAARALHVDESAGEPLINKTFTDEDLRLVSSAVLRACDRLDGAADGMVQDFTNCTTDRVQPELRALACATVKSETCLAPSQIAALEKVFAGAHASGGERLYAPWAWDAGIGGTLAGGYNQGWRAWKLGAYGSPANTAINLTLGASALPSIFATPPIPVASWGGSPAAFSLHVDMDRAEALIGATSGPFRESAVEFMTADHTDLSAFSGRGGRLIIAQGVSDPVFSILDTVEWWRAVDRTSGGRASDFVRLFAVPGMNHCTGGPATDQFDAFGALVSWVERGAAPDRIVATARSTTPWPGRSRPLCPFPKVAHFNGSGNIETADSFECR
jgi:feruloyl esterase